MARFTAAKIVAFTRGGDLISAPAEQWKLSGDMRSGIVTASHRGEVQKLALADAMAIEVQEEREVRAVGRTIGRMALTGIGASLFSQGRHGGLGASLLDLSARGSERKTQLVGTIVWPDLSMADFLLEASEVPQFLKVIPESAFAEQALENAQQRLDLVQRMRNDGMRALEELGTELIAMTRRAAQQEVFAEQNATFAQRDAARKEVAVLHGQIIAARQVCRALLFDLGLSYRDLAQRISSEDDAVELLGLKYSTVDSLPSQQPSTPPRSTSMASASNNTPNYTKMRLFRLTAFLVVIFVLLVVLGYIQQR